MPSGDGPGRTKLNEDAQSLLVELGTTPMDVYDIAAKYDRTPWNVRHRLVPRAREYGRANGIVIDRPIHTDGYLYRAHWEWSDHDAQGPNWSVALSDTMSRSRHMQQDMASYTAQAKAEGRDSLADALEDIHDLMKMATKSVAKASLIVSSGPSGS